jgi:hypothetical protein
MDNVNWMIGLAIMIIRNTLKRGRQDKTDCRPIGVKIDLSEADINLAHNIATARMDDAIQHSRKPKGLGTYETNFQGALGEIAVSKWSGVDLEGDYSYIADVKRGYDVAGYQVRTRGKSWYDLGLHSGDSGRFILALAHDAPVIWLAGWIDIDCAYVGMPGSHTMTTYDYTWICMPQLSLNPMDTLSVIDHPIAA